MNINLLYGVAILVFFLTVSPITQASPPPISNRIAIFDAIAEKNKKSVIILAIKPGTSDEFEREVTKYRARIDYNDRITGYYRIKVAPEDVAVITALPSVVASAVAAGNWHLASPRGKQDVPVQQAMPSFSVADYISQAARDKRYDWREPMGLRSLWEKSPQYDGRGVTIAIIELLPDLTSPNLQTALDIHGRTVPKVVGVYGFHNREADDNQVAAMEIPGLAKFSPVSSTGSGKIEYGGKSVLTPGTGEFEIAFIEKSDLISIPSYLKAQQNNGNAFVAVLRRPSSKCVWVDTNLDNSLLDERCIGEFNSTRDYGRMRVSGDANSQPPFFIVPTHRPDVMRIGKPSSHTHAVSLTAVGNRFWGTKLGGTAPQARLLTLDAGGREDEVIEAAIFAARDKNVDVIVPMIGSTHNVSHGLTVYNIVLDRIAEAYNKVVLHPAGNGDRQYNYLLPRSTGERTLSIAQFHAGRLSSLFEGSRRIDRVPYASSGGPAADGGLKPDLTASSSIVISSEAHFARSDEVIRRLVCPAVSLDRLAACFGGTSGATPSAAGAVAVLISAARLAGLSYTEADIRSALQATARSIPGEHIFLQGRGVLQIPAAIEYLTRFVREKPVLSRIEVTGSSDAFWASVPPRSGKGRGLNETRGWHPGSKGLRYISVKRTDGRTENQEFHFELIGNHEETFNVNPKHRLPIGQNVRIPIQIHTRTHGVHSALLRITDPKSSMVVADIGLYVVASFPLRAENNYTVDLKGTYSRAAPTAFFLDVPPGLASLSIRNIPADYLNGPLDTKLRGPAGLSYDPEEFAGLKQRHHVNTTEPKTTWTLSEYMPSPGLWTVMIASDRNIPDKIHQISFKATGQPFSLAPDEQYTVPALTSSFLSNKPRSPSFLALVKGKRYSGKITIKPGQLPPLIAIDAPRYTSLIDARIRALGNYSEDIIPVAVSAINCTDRCRVSYSSVGNSYAGIMALIQPHDRWQVAIDAGEQHVEPIEVEYDIFVKSQSIDSKILQDSLKSEVISGYDIASCLGGENIFAVEFGSEHDLHSRFSYMRRKDDSTRFLINPKFNTYIPLARKYLECVQNNDGQAS